MSGIQIPVNVDGNLAAKLREANTALDATKKAAEELRAATGLSEKQFLAAQKAVEAQARSEKAALESAAKAQAELAKEIAKAQAELEKQDGLAKRLSGSWTEMASKLSVARQAIGMFAGAVQSIAQGAAAFEAQRAAVTRLGSAYQAVQDATAGTVAAQDALRVQQSLVQAGLRVTDAELATAIRGARDYARATGTDVSQAIDQMVDALRGGEAEGLRRFGISVAEGTTKSDAFRIALTQLAARQREGAPASRSLAESNELLARSWTEVSNGLSAVLAQELRFGEFATHATDWLRDIASGSRSLTEELGDMMQQLIGWEGQSYAVMRQEAHLRGMQTRRTEYETLMRGATAAGVRTDGLPSAAQFSVLSEEQRSRLSAALGGAAAARGARRDIEGNLDASDAAGWQGRRELNAVAWGGVRRADQALRDALRSLSPAGAAASAPTRRARSGGGGAAPDPEMDRLRQQGSAFALASMAQRETDAAHDRAFLGVEADAAVAEGERDAENQRGKGAAQSAMDEATKTEAARQRELERARSFTGSLSALFAEQETTAQRAAKGIRAAFDGMASAIGSHIEAVVSGRESLGEALQGMLSDTLGSIAKEAASRAGMSAAMALFSLATGNFASAGTFGAAAAGFTAVAALAGVAASATKPSSASASAGTGGGLPAAARAGGSPGGSGGPTQITIIYGAGVLSTPRDLAQHVAGVLNGGAVLGGVRLDPRLVGGAA